MSQFVHSTPLVNLYCDDCNDFMREWCNARDRDFPLPLFDAIITDPPFNIGQDYDCHNDEMTTPDFDNWFCNTHYNMEQMVRNGGIVAINVPDDMVYMVERQAFLRKWQRIDWIIWHYRFGQCGDSKFINSKTHILVYRIGSVRNTWNPNAVMVESDRFSTYSDRRTFDSATPGKRVPLDVWCNENDGPHWSRLVGNNAEKILDHPNQQPEKVIERLILAYTNPGDLILEPFAGSGTVPVVCDAHGRRCVAVEKSARYCSDIAVRMEKGMVR